MSRIKNLKELFKTDKLYIPIKRRVFGSFVNYDRDDVMDALRYSYTSDDSNSYGWNYPPADYKPKLRQPGEKVDTSRLKKCECGLDKSGAGGKHAPYCPKYEED